MKFTINKGWHYSYPFFLKPHCNIESVHFYDVKLDKNCWYERDQVEYTGINKLAGVGFGWNHHINSIRVGWQPNFDKKDYIKLHAYWYDQSDKGQYQEQYICDVKVNQKFDFNIDIFDDSYILNLCDNKFQIEKTHNKKWGFYLRPYFGGKSKAPAKMKIWVKKKSFK